MRASTAIAPCGDTMTGLRSISRMRSMVSKLYSHKAFSS